MATTWTPLSFQGRSSKSTRGIVGTTVATMVTCKEPAVRVLIQNQDATAANVATFAINDTPTAGANGVNVPGANFVQEFFMTYGDVLYGIAAADREVDIIVTPYF